jgi:hypothetical protein
MDELAIESNVEMALIKTRDASSWTINIENFMIGIHSIIGINLQTRKVLFDLNVPYTYIPDSDY